MQDRLTYANGNTITTEGFRCSVGEPIDIKVTVGEDEEVNLQGEAGKIITYGDYLITLEVNGEKAAYRDLYHLGDPVTVGDYTISDDMYLDGVSEGDEVVMRLEPVELMVTDAFRAAVKSLGGAASDSSGGGSGGGVLVVHEVQHQGETLVSGTLPNVAGYAYSSTHEDGRIDLTVVGIGDTIPLSSVVVTIGTETYSGDSDLVVQRTDTLRVKLKGEQQYPESAITGLSITVVESYTALDHTWQEISDAGFAVLNDHGGILVASGIYAVAGAYGVEFYICYDDGQGSVGINVFNFSTSSVSGYPARTP